jgi:inosine/xanthosine triphosphate pyrophosphatase family protein
MKEVLVATYNPHKKERFEYYLTQLGLSVIGLEDIAEGIKVVENGSTPEENALKKAFAGYNAAEIPTLGIDYWFHIEGLPDELQPNSNVRRIPAEFRQGERATDEEMLKYYTGLVSSLGGRAKGLWTSAAALVISSDIFYTEGFTRKTILTAELSLNKTPGEPLNSIQIDPRTGKYFTDMSTEEWLALQSEREKGYIRFVQDHMHEF